MNTILGGLGIPRKRQVFYSFHYANDAFRTQQVRNMGAIEGNSPCSPSAWETVKRQGDAAIERWIDENMRYRSCLVVLVGRETAFRPWVRYEICKAWDEKKGVLGVYIHSLRCPREGLSIPGPNPFSSINLQNGSLLSTRVNCYDPGPDAYNGIRANLDGWIEHAIRTKRQ